MADLAQNSILVGKERFWNRRSGFPLCISAESFESKLGQCQKVLNLGNVRKGKILCIFADSFESKLGQCQKVSNLRKKWKCKKNNKN